MAKRPTASTKASDSDTPVQPKARKKKAAPAPASSPAGPEPTLDDIRRRAYERYQERGGNHGKHFDDWLEAEKELRNKK
jgi:Protein of unknown function (DUF2934)